MTAPPAGTVLCRLDDIDDPGAKGFEFGAGVERWEVFVVRRGDRVFAYENACPHQGTPLETWPDKFLTRDQSEILCTTHGAQFRIEDGYCTRGPCKGKALVSVAVAVSDGSVLLA